jgi:hypothetical protein
MGNIRKPGHGFLLLSTILLGAILLSAGCAGLVPSSQSRGMGSPGASNDNQSWKEYSLTNLTGRENFSMNAFSGKTVLVPVVSVACPTCIDQLQRQLDEVSQLPGVRNGKITVVALDIDSPDGPGFIASYAPGFSGYSARSPENLTLQILDTFGPFSISTNTIPVILICPDGRDHLLPPGVKTADMLNRSISEC